VIAGLPDLLPLLRWQTRQTGDHCVGAVRWGRSDQSGSLWSGRVAL